MNLNKYDQLPYLREDFFFPIEQTFNKFFDDFFGKPNDGFKSNFGYPKMDVVKESDDLVIKLAIPGVVPSDVKVEVHDKVLKVSGKMAEEYHSSPCATYYVKELKKSSFVRQVTLPTWINGDPEAVMKDGILKLSWPLPKKAEKQRSKLIPIKTE